MVAPPPSSRCRWRIHAFAARAIIAAAHAHGLTPLSAFRPPRASASFGKLEARRAAPRLHGPLLAFPALPTPSSRDARGLHCSRWRIRQCRCRVSPHGLYYRPGASPRHAPAQGMLRGRAAATAALAAGCPPPTTTVEKRLSSTIESARRQLALLRGAGWLSSESSSSPADAQTMLMRRAPPPMTPTAPGFDGQAMPLVAECTLAARRHFNARPSVMAERYSSPGCARTRKVISKKMEGR